MEVVWKKHFFVIFVAFVTIIEVLHLRNHMKSCLHTILFVILSVTNYFECTFDSSWSVAEISKKTSFVAYSF